MLSRSRWRLVRLGIVVCLGLALQSLVGPTPPAGAATRWSVGSSASYGATVAGLYTYAPSAVSAGGSTYYFTCHNSVRGVIRDSVWFAEVRGGRLIHERPVLTPSRSGWDSHHVCDPSVVAGRFGFAGRTYSYAMFYLGTAADNTGNQIGVAFADELAGPWTRSPAPVVGIPDSASSTWGVGQPSAVTLDASSGSVVLFYTDGTAGTVAYRQILILGTGGWERGEPAPVPTTGLHGDVLHNFDAAYDVEQHRFYIAREAGARPTSTPRNISTSVEVDSMNAVALASGTGSWRVEGRITPQVTHLSRNHNPGILRTVYGTLPSSGVLGVVVSGAATEAFPAVLSSYDLWTVSRKLPVVVADRVRNPGDRAAPPLREWSGALMSVDRFSSETAGRSG